MNYVFLANDGDFDVVKLDKITGADPGFLDRGFKLAEGVRFVQFGQFFSEIPNEIEIILSQEGVRLNPLTPLWIRH